LFELEIEKRKTQINRKPTRPKLPNPSPTRFLLGSTHSLPARPTLPPCWTRPLGLPPHPGLPRSRLSQRLGPARHLRSTARSLTRTPAQPPASYRLARGPRPSLAHLAAAVSRPPAQRAGLRPALSLHPGPIGRRRSARAARYAADQRGPLVGPVFSPFLLRGATNSARLAGDLARAPSGTDAQDPAPSFKPPDPLRLSQSNRTPPATLAHRPSELRVEQSPHAAGKRARHRFSPPPATQSSP